MTTPRLAVGTKLTLHKGIEREEQTLATLGIKTMATVDLGTNTCLSCGLTGSEKILIDAGHVVYAYCPLCAIRLAREIAHEAKILMQQLSSREYDSG